MSSPRSLKFRFDWRATALVLLFLPIVISLGFWQLDRAEQKRQLQALFDQRQINGAVDILLLDQDADLRYQPVRLLGQFRNQKTLYLDNRIYQGRFGYEIITPFELADNRLVLVNRGWLAGDPGRRSLPEVEAIAGRHELLAEVYVPHKAGFNYQQSVSAGWPKVMQSVNPAALAEELGVVFPYTVRLSGGSAGSYQANWPIVNIQPGKHTGYAFQWFSMAVALLVIALLSNTNLWQCLKARRTQAEN